MSASNKIIQAAAGNAAGEALYVEDVFSTYLYEGNGSTQTITNGVDLDGEGGLVWIKNRGSGGHLLSDSARSSIGNYLITNSTNAEANPGNFINSYNSNGFTLGTWVANTSGDDYVSWTFRKAPKFFDVVTYTGNGVGGRQINHNLGSVPGMVIVKNTSAGGDWRVWHRAIPGDTNDTGLLVLNSTQERENNKTNIWAANGMTDSYFTVSTTSPSNLNESGQSYVAYFFAHNNSDGEFGEDADQDIIKCGSVLISSSTPGTDVVDLGFEPQWVLIKRATGTEDWIVLDNMRGLAAPPNSSSNSNALWPNLSSAENNSSQGIGPSALYNITPTGFSIGNDLVNTGQTYIYIAIRRGPMKTPESGTEVFAIDTKNVGFPSFISGFPVDMGIQTQTIGDSNLIASRLTGPNGLKTDSTAAEDSNSGRTWDYMNGWYDWSGAVSTNISWMFRRAPGFFDVVAYEGTGSATTVSHNLGVVPELMIIRPRNFADNWLVCAPSLVGNNKHLRLNNSNALYTDSTVLNATNPTNEVFTVGTSTPANSSGDSIIAYLFATLPGVSKVGIYTGNSSTQTIDCGFTNGARFVLIKSYNDGGDWQVFDTERGIVAGDDERLLLNSTAAESSDDYIDPHSSGFSLPNHPFTNSNAQGQKYIFLAIA